MSPGAGPRSLPSPGSTARPAGGTVHPRQDESAGRRQMQAGMHNIEEGEAGPTALAFARTPRRLNYCPRPLEKFTNSTLL